MRELVGRVPLLGYDRMHQEQTNVAHHAKVTGGRDRKTFSLATNEDTITMGTMSFFYTVDCTVYGSGRPECKSSIKYMVVAVVSDALTCGTETGTVHNS